MGLLTIQWAPIEMVRSGDYAGAVAALGDSWPGIGQKPLRGGTTDKEYALLLLACGLLSIRLGRMKQTNALEFAKDMLSESARLLSGEPEECAAQLYLGSAYSDCGEYQEALAIADSVLVMEADSEVVIGASVLKATALKRQGLLNEAWNTLEAARPLADAVLSVSKGNYFIERGNLQRRFGNLDQAIAEYDQAEHVFLNAGSLVYVGVALNNVAGVYLEQQRFNLAHNAVSRAADLFRKSGDRAFEAKALDQTAKIYLAQDKPCEAEPIARRAVLLLENGDNKSWLAEALITHARTLMRMGTDQAIARLERAAEICETIGDSKQGQEANEELVNVFKNSRTLMTRLREITTKLQNSVIRYTLKLHGNRIPPAATSLGISRQALEDRLKRIEDVKPAKRRRGKSLFRNPTC